MEEIIFPNQIRMFRRVRGKSMQSLADAMGLSLSAISKIEKGYRRIDEKQLETLCAFLDCPKEAVFVSPQSQPEVIRAWKEEQERRKKMNSGGGLKTLGAGLRYIRGEKKLTLMDVARGARLTLSVYHRIEVGQREVEEKVFRNIAKALGMSEEELQIRIYELDMSGALDDLKQKEGKSGIFAAKGGYNDLPLSRFMMRSADSKEITISIYGRAASNNLISIDSKHPVGSMICPSTMHDIEGLYGIRLVRPLLGDVLPKHAVLVVAPRRDFQDGDLAVHYVNETDIEVFAIHRDQAGNLIAQMFFPAGEKLISSRTLSQLHKVVMIAMP